MGSCDTVALERTSKPQATSYGVLRHAHPCIPTVVGSRVAAPRGHGLPVGPGAGRPPARPLTLTWKLFPAQVSRFLNTTLSPQKRRCCGKSARGSYRTHSKRMFWLKSETSEKEGLGFLGSTNAEILPALSTGAKERSHARSRGRPTTQ